MDLKIIDLQRMQFWTKYKGFDIFFKRLHIFRTSLAKHFMQWNKLKTENIS